MKKIYLLSAICALAFTSCQKEKTVSQSPATKTENTTVTQPSRLKPMTAWPGGSGATIVYDSSTGKYRANYGGAELVFSPVPNNTNYSDNDIAYVGMSCTNCTDFTANSSYFTAVIPVLPAASITDIHQKLAQYYQDFNDFINRAKDANGQYKQFTLPNYPSVSSTYSGTVSGVVVRSHTSPSTCMIMPATFVPNIPGSPNILNMEIGGIFAVDPVTGHNVYYDIFIDPATGNILNVTASDQVTHQTLSNVTYTGTCTITGTGVNQSFFVTLKVYIEGQEKINVVNHQVVD